MHGDDHCIYAQVVKLSRNQVKFFDFELHSKFKHRISTAIFPKRPSNLVDNLCDYLGGNPKMKRAQAAGSMVDGRLTEKHLLMRWLARRFPILFFGLGLVTGCSYDSATVPDPDWRSTAPISIPYLTHRDYQSSLRITRKLGDFSGYSSYAVAWDSNGLLQSAVMNVPASAMPAAGFPVLIMNHGNANNRWDELKKYYSTDQEAASYRELSFTELITRFAREGFVVLAPDYRGHGYSETNGKNKGYWQLDRQGHKVIDKQGEHVPRIFDNNGLRFGGWLYSAHYTIDILNLIAAIRSIDNPPDSLSIDRGNLFLWGRSLGGDVTARAMTASNKVKAASLWVPATTSLWDQAHFYHYDSPTVADGFSLEALAVEIGKYNRVHGTQLVARDLNPANFIEQVRNPVMIQVSIDDPDARSAWGIEYHFELQEYGVPTVLKIYPGDAHVFAGDLLERAIQADLEFFRAAMD